MLFKNKVGTTVCILRILIFVIYNRIKYEIYLGTLTHKHHQYHNLTFQTIHALIHFNLTRY